jgi:hypothetical protein
MKASEKQITVLEYVIGFASFIPVLGVLLGLVSVVLGSLRFKVGGWKLILLGVGGIFFTVVFYGVLFNYFFKSELGKTEIYQKIALQNLRQTVMTLEFYKQVHGKYPDHLEDLFEKKPYASHGETYLYDSSGGFATVAKLQLHQYELSSDGQSYHLFDVGSDGQPNTADDIFPELSQEEMDHIGYRKK